jgi:hypothetical protein
MTNPSYAQLGRYVQIRVRQFLESRDRLENWGGGGGGERCGVSQLREIRGFSDLNQDGGNEICNEQVESRHVLYKYICWQNSRGWH